MQTKWNVISANINLKFMLKLLVSFGIFILICRAAIVELQGAYIHFDFIGLYKITVVIFKGFLSVMLGIPLCYSIFKIEKLIDVYKKSDDRSKGIPYAIYFASMFALLFNPLDKLRNAVTEFNRVIGHGLVYDVDVLKRVDNFYQWFIIFAAVFILFYLIANYWKNQERCVEYKKTETFLDNFIIVANCELALSCITYFYAPYRLSTYLIAATIFIALLYIHLDFGRYITAECVAILMLSIVSISYPVALAVVSDLESALFLIGMLFIILCALSFFFVHKKGALKDEFHICAIHAAALILPLLPLVTSLYIEAIYVLNQYGIFITRPVKYYNAVFMVMVSALLGVAFILKRTGQSTLKWKNWAYPIFLAGVASLTVQLPISFPSNPDLFEGANAGILISDFLNFGKLPIIEHYGGHMMTAVWEGILYGLVNRDYIGAAVSPYQIAQFPVLTVLFFYLIKKIWNEDLALWVTLLLPFYNSWQTYGLGMLVCIAAMAYINKETYVRAFLLWAAMAWCTLYRLDLGYAFVMPAIIAMAAYIVVTKNKKAAKELGISFIMWAILGLAAWCILCSSKGIDPVSRLNEFMLISLSNQNWAYNIIGNYHIMLFSWSYIFMPFLIALCLAYATFAKHFRERIGLDMWVLLQLLGWSYFVNLPRGLVRHSLAEMATSIVVWCGYLFLAIFFSFYSKNKKLFLPVFIILILCNSLFVSNANFLQFSIVDNFVRRQAAIITDLRRLRNVHSVIQRVEFTDNIKKYAQKYWVIDCLLEKDETFADFINKTLLYSLLGRECPTYVSQSPLQLSGEFTQSAFIKQIAKCPIVLMPVDEENFRCSNSLDGITNAYRYYKVSEYIFQNYVPLCRYGMDYALWCSPEKYEPYKTKLSKHIVKPVEYIDSLLYSTKVELDDLALTPDDGAVVVRGTGAKPRILELQNVIDITKFIGDEMMLSVKYESDVPGTMQLFYINDNGAAYTEENSLIAETDDNGTAVFLVPVTEYTRLRLDMPEKGTIKITSISAQSPCQFIGYGYDGPIEDADTNSYKYISMLHNHVLLHLPRIWAESDEGNANNNKVITELQPCNGRYIIRQNPLGGGGSGNYLKITAAYDGNGKDGLYKNDDEELEASVVLGYAGGDKFIEKVRYSMIFKEGRHDYLIRCSTDYYWYTGEINAVKIMPDGELRDIEMRILEGD